MTKEKDIELPKMFDENPELKKKLIEHLRKLPLAEKQRDVRLVQKFLEGEITWAEVKDVPKRLLKEIAKIAYLKFKQQDFKKAEILFKGLALLDHLNWYYRAALGAVFQKQGLFEQAIEEYDMALRLKADEATSLLNRGQCFLKFKDFDAALQDFDAVLKLPLDKNSPWRKRAQTLSQAVLMTKGKSK